MKGYSVYHSLVAMIEKFMETVDRWKNILCYMAELSKTFN